MARTAVREFAISIFLIATLVKRQDLTLVSAWIKPRAFDDEVVEMLCDAIARGVSVRIAWGLGTTTRGAENERNRVVGQSTLKQLKGRIPSGDRGRLVEKRTETHEKYIICDDLFCAFGSFNWLSYRGELDDRYRREVSYYTEREEDVRLFRDRSDELFREVDRDAAYQRVRPLSSVGSSCTCATAAWYEVVLFP